MGSEVHLRKYGEATTFNFDLFEVDGVDLRVDAVHASGDSKIMKDEGAEANTASGFVDEGQGYSIAASATEMEAARIKIVVVDQTATKVWLDRTITIETYGHASAQHAFDLDTAQQSVAVASLGADVITNAAIADVTFGNEHFADGCIDADVLAANTIAAAKIAADAFTAAKFATDCMTDDALAASWVTEINAGAAPTIMQTTTIATLASQTSFTLTAGSADDDAYNLAFALVVDQTTGAQQCICDITDYTGATKTITLGSDPGIFTMATGDTIHIIAVAPGTSAPTAAQNRAEMDSNSTQLAAIVADTNELQTDDIPGTLATIDGIVDSILVDTGTTIPGTITTVDANVDAVLVDTGTTIPGTLTTIEGKVDTVDANVDAVLVDTGTTLPATLATIDGIVDSILTDTGTTLDTKINTLDTLIDAITAKMPTNYVMGSAVQTDKDDDIDAILVDTGTTLPATEWQVDVVKISGDATAADNLESYCDGTDNQPVDVKEIDSDTTAATNLSKSALGIVPGACEGTPTTTVIQTDLTEATDDHYIGRVIVFTSGVAAGQGAAITDYTGATGTVTVGATTLTTAPVATDTFVIV